jgi:subtilisin family serine protease/Tol biopolymer transport system component
VRLQYELLEPRHLLAAEIGLSQSAAAQQQNVANAPITWFEAVTGVQRVPLASLASVDRLLPEGVAGPIPRAAGEWIVQLRDAAARTVRRLGQADTLLDDLNNDFTVISGLGARGALLIRGDGPSRADIEASLRANPSVQSFQLNQLIQGQATTPNESDFAAGLLPGLNKINATSAWDESIGSMSTVVGVVDSGIDPTHPDLYLNIWVNQGEIPPEFLDDDGHKLVDIDGDGLITFYDLNNLKRTPEGIVVATTGVLATQAELTNATPFASGENRHFVRDLNNNGRIDADDLLKDALWTSGTDNDGNGFFDDIFGVNFRAGAGDPFASNNPTDELGHGTHVAGTIGAIGNNNTGVVGVNWQTSLMSLRILDNNNQGDSGAAIRAINYARDMRERLTINSANRVTEGADVKVLNNSWGQPGGYEASLESAIKQLYEANILFVAAAGNGNILGNGVDNDRTPFYPASYDVPNVIAVAAADANDRLATFSNFGRTSVDILAPGVGIRSTVPGGGYQSANGTSMAAPHVAGTAALIWSALPEATVDEVNQAILSTTTPSAQPNIVATGGRLNVAVAINADVFAPAARLIAKQDITTTGGTHTEFTIEYSHRSGIDITSIGDDDIIVTRQWGPAEVLTATLSRPIAAEDITATTLKATYRVTAPGGTWDALDFGDYLISTQTGTVVTEAGARPIQRRDIGRFNVRITNDPSIAGHDPSVIYVDQFGDSLESGSLRSAIITANAAFPSPRTIILQSGKYTIDIPAVIDPDSTFGTSLESLGIANPGGWTNATTGDFDIQGNITIVGDINDDTIIDAQGVDRVFKVHANSVATLSRLTIQGGISPANQGGGGILSIGELNLDQAILKQNAALSIDAFQPIFGGAIASWNGNASLEQSWITENQSDFGGGLYYTGSATVAVQRTTFDNNKGGGIYSSSSGDGTVENSTFSSNVGGYGAIANVSLLPNSIHGRSSISGDGRYVAFESLSNTLVFNDTNGVYDIFVFDRFTKSIERVPFGVQPNNESFRPSLSADGRYVAFESTASNLVASHVDERSDVFVYDTMLKTIEQVSLNNDGEDGDFSSRNPSLSADGRYVAFESNASNLVPGDFDGMPDIYVYDRSEKKIERVSVNDAGIEGNGESTNPSISANGRYVTFTSTASNLVPGDTNDKEDIFVYDRTTKSIERVSVDNFGTQGNDSSGFSKISEDGRFVTFQSWATNLVPGDTNDFLDIFLFDRSTKQIERINVSTSGTQGNGNSASPSLSADGRYVAFASDASNLVPNDTNNSFDAFLYDRIDKVLVKASTGVSPTRTLGSGGVSLSADGRFVSFGTNHSNFGSNSFRTDIFVFDRITDSVEPISYQPIKSAIDVMHSTIAYTADGLGNSAVYGDVRTTNSLFIANEVTADIISRYPSSDSHHNVLSDAPQSNSVLPLQRLEFHPPVHHLIAGNPAINSASVIGEGSRDQLGRIRNIPDAGAVEAVSATVGGKVYLDANRNGRLDSGELGIPGVEISIVGTATTTVISESDNPQTLLVNESGDFNATDLPIGVHQLAAQPPSGWSSYVPPLEVVRRGSVLGNDSSDNPKLSADARYVTFSSFASNLVSGDTNRIRDTFVYDRKTGSIERMSVSDDGSQGSQFSDYPTLSADGRYVAFQSLSDNLVPGDTNGRMDVFVYDRNTNLIERVSVSNFGGQGNGESFRPSLSADGRYVAFGSVASNLVPGDNNEMHDVFVYDRTTNSVEMVSVSDAGTPGNGTSMRPSISSDGRFVTFVSGSSNLVPGDTNGRDDIFVYDRNTKLIERVSVNNDGVQGTGSSSQPSLSGNGRYVTFDSTSTFVSGDTNGTSDVFVYDRATRLIERISVNDSGAGGNGSSTNSSISSDGRYVAFESSSTNLVPGDTNGQTDIFVYDRTTKLIRLVSASDTGIQGNFSSSNPSISADGLFITFTSVANNLFAGDTNGVQDVFVVPNPLAPRRVSLDLEVGDVISDLNFGLIPNPGTISGRVFEDTVANGVFDDGEPAVVNAVVFLDIDGNMRLDDGEPFVTTDEDGNFQFLDVDSFQSYSIVLQVPIGFERVSPGTSEQFAWNLFLPAGGTITDRDFAIRRIQSTGQSSNSAVSGRLFEDKDGDGAYSEGIDVPIAGFEVFLDASNFGVRDDNEPRTLTDSQGRYSFDRLSARNVAVTTVLGETLVHVNPLGSQFGLEKFPLFGAVTPFGNPQAIASGDFNGDGFLDVAVALGEANKASIRLNDGLGGFLPEEIDIDLGTAGAGPTSLVVGQFDDDERIDVALTANFTGNVTILLNFDPVSKTFASTAYVEVGDEPLDIAAGDFTGNGKADLVVVNKADNTVQLLTNNGSGVFTAGPGVPTGGRNSGSIVVGNFTGDASLDVAVVHASPLTTATPFGGMTVLRGNGSGGLTRMPEYYTVGATPTDSVVGDFNGDGRQDIAISNFSSNSISILLGQADGTFRVQTAILGTASGAFDITAADIDNDGDIDVIVSNLRDRNISIFRNIGVVGGEVQFEPLENIGLGQFSLAQRMPLVMGNFDNDTSGPGGTGTIDIVTIPQRTDTLHVLKNTLVNGSHRVALTGLNTITGRDFIIKPAILPPSFNAIANPLAIFEDAALQSITVTGIVKGRTTGPQLQFTATSSNPALIASPTVTYSGGTTATVQYTPLANMSGTTVITVRAVDAGADAAFGGPDDGIFERSFTVSVLAVNDAPVFNLVPEATVLQTDGATTIANFVTGMGNGGGADEASQTLDPLVVTAGDPSFFSVQPAINAAGTLTFTPNPNKSGSVPVTVTLKDSGGRANGGVDTTTKTFLVVIGPVNDAPSFTLMANPNRSVVQMAGPQTINNFVTSFSPGGGDDEATQTVSDYIVTVDGPGIFAVLPDISNDGTLTFTPAIDRTGLATVSVQVRDSGGRANGGNDLSAVTTFTISVASAADVTRPTPVISYVGAALTNQTTFDVEVDFKEPMAAGTFTISDFTVSKGATSNLRDLGGGKFVIAYTGDGQGEVAFGVAANVATDLAGNQNFAATSITRTIDTVGITPTVSSTAPAVSNVTSFVVAIAFGEPTIGFTLSDIVVLNGTASNLVTVNTSTGSYTATITPAADGTVTVLLPAGSVTDAAGNANVATTPLIRTVDRTAPVAVISTTEPSRTNKTTFDVIAEFGEAVTGLAANDLMIQGGTTGAPVLLSPGRYRFPITATNGPVQIQLAASAVTDAAGNSNAASNTINLTIDTAAFVPVLSSTSNAVLNTNTFNVAVDFGKAVASFTGANITLSGGTASNITTVDAASGKYSFTVTATDDGSVTVLVAAGVVRDTAGNGNSASNSLVRTVDRVAPRPTLSANVPALTNQASFIVTIDFGKEVTGFTLSDIVTTGATLSSLQSLGAGHLTATATSTGGPVTFNIPASAANDLAGNASLAATTLALTVDLSAPLPTLSTTAPALSNAASFTVAANFGEEVVGFAIGDLLLINGVASGFTEVNRATGSYTFVVTPSSDGVVSVLVPAGSATDRAANLTLASSLLSRSFDRTVPIPVLSTTEPSRTNKTTFEAIVNFGEPVTGLTRSDFTVTGATISDPLDLGSGRYAINITATADVVEVSLPAGVAFDNAGNPSSASNLLVRAIETTRVLPLLNASIPPVSNVGSFVVSIDFTTQVVGFSQSSLFAVGGTMSDFAVVDELTGKYSVRVTPSADGVVTLLLPANAATDSVGNGNLAAAPLVQTIDRVAPAITLSTSQSSPTLETSFAVIVQSSKAITGLTASSFQVSGGTIGQPLPLGDGRYSVAVTATGGLFELSVLGGSVTDAAGNVNAASNVLRVDVSTRSSILAPTLDGQSIDLTAMSDADLVNLETIDLRGFGDNVLWLDSDKIRSLFENSSVTVYADPGDTILFDGDWRFEGIELVGGEVHRVFTNSGATIRTIGPGDFTNPRNRFDVDGSGEVSALDALHVLTAIRAQEIVDSQGGFLPLTAENKSSFQFVDVNQDKVLTPLDALLVLIEMRRMISAGEGESGEQVMAPPPLQSSVSVAAATQSRGETEDLRVGDEGLQVTDAPRQDLRYLIPFGPQFQKSGTITDSDNTDEVSKESVSLIDEAFADPLLL